MMTFTKWALASVDGWVCFKIVLYSSFLHLNTFITMSAMNVLKLGLTELRTKISFVWIFVCNSEWTVWWTPGLFLCVRLHFLWESRRGTNEHRRGGTSQNPTEGTIGHGVSGGFFFPPFIFVWATSIIPLRLHTWVQKNCFYSISYQTLIFQTTLRHYFRI